MNEAIKISAIKNARKHRLKLADSIILATAQHIGVPLLTADLEFNKVDDENQDVIIVQPV